MQEVNCAILVMHVLCHFLTEKKLMEAFLAKNLKYHGGYQLSYMVEDYNHGHTLGRVFV